MKKDIMTRAVKTVAQTMLSMITVGQSVSEIDWYHVLSVSLAAGIISLLMSVVSITTDDSGTGGFDE